MPWIDIFLPFLVMLLASTIIESMLRPRPIAIWQRDWHAVALFVLTLCCLFGVYIALTRRPWLSAALSAALPGLLTGVSNIKHTQLREPLLYTDWRYFWEMIRYPSLYLPYFGTGMAVLLFMGFIVVLVGWTWLEPPVLGVIAGIGWGGGLALVSALISIWLLNRWDVSKRPLEPLVDVHEWGGLAAHWVYRKRLHENVTLPEAPFIHISRPINVMPDLICIQAESFVDRRRWELNHLGVTTPALPHWDRLREQSVRYGQLIVPAWGANTVRTEFAVLTGLNLSAIGTHRFDPYRSMLMRDRMKGLVGLPGWLGGQGYQSIFVHPYERTFYGRNQVIPQLGFERFIDLTAFEPQDYAGQYVSDVAVGRRIIQELDHPSPSFIYAVTIQGHGPYGSSNLSVEKTLANFDQCMLATDRMLGEIQKRLLERDRPAVLCVFGDHVPSMPSVYAKLGDPDGMTDYLIWSSLDSLADGEQGKFQILHADKLSLAMLHAAGFNSVS